LAWKIFVWTEFSLKLSSGIRLCICNRADFPILQEIFIERSYEPFIAYLGEVKNWLDIGCNCGLFSLYLEDVARTHQWEGPRNAVLIDANRFALRTARRSIDANQLQSSFYIEKGIVGKRSGTLSFYESKSTYKSSVFKLSSKEKATELECLDLLQASKRLPGLDLIKMDIEGAEMLVIEEWPDVIRRARHLLIEWHTPHASGAGLDDKLKGLGFKLVKVAPPAYLASEPADLNLPIGTGLWTKNTI
jgi:FkbM family methyltransferase